MNRPYRPRGHSLAVRFVAILLVTVLASLALVQAVHAAESSAVPKTLDELRAMQERLRETVKKVLPTVVGVQIGTSRGSGVIVSEDGYVMTAGHVVGKPGQPVTFVFHDGETAKGKTLGMFKTYDAGLMKIEDKGDWSVAEKGKSHDLHQGDWCIASGHPLGYKSQRPPVIRLGRILRSDSTVVQTDCALVGGDSGGPLFDMDGRVIAINSRIGPSMQLNIHVPVDVFEENWDKLVAAEEWEAELPARDAEEMKAALRPVITDAAECVCRIQCDGKDVALGTIIGPDGWILTKASELRGNIVCKLRDDRKLEARWIGSCEETDLAVLKIDTVGLPTIQWSKEKPEVGGWVAAPGLDKDPVALGVISIPPLMIPPERGMLGVVLIDDSKGAKVEKIVPNSPAQKAGLRAGDIIEQVQDHKVGKREDLVDFVKQFGVGKKLILKILRDNRTKDVEVTLGKVDSEALKKQEMQNRLGVGLSNRSNDFPLVLQHDGVVKPTDCGGPLVDLSGNVIGINIARGGRTESYALPSELILEQLYPLMAGLRTPEHVLAARKKADEEAKKKAEEEIRRKAEEEAKRLAEEEAAAKKKAEEEAAAKKKAEEEAAAKKKAEEEAAAKKKAEEEAAAKKKAEEEAARKAEEEKKQAEKDAQQEAEKKADAESELRDK